ncbi:MAG: hypothetical protein CO030_03560 [Candidatus Magasanikbacteria bacterium CG_4_9_14_0_2_um_filter_42_11]|uniref:PEP-utilising enzyme mobile domain-containing protein n=1 Tax=Candidatus Magasanikbacteria bacterium CG_4_9_14_0_2_um_filter_42_11 TaxID=1974643 RepID=A0A2M8F980_9BACT|nr:MAG: hypothetical protein COU34_01170 [Candidatus Magasanikbacteria bacterium CG10_big_fil_rev_8_21_14_0_10_43_9]PJC52305.1 MAG: hypothetical protein CO030_03560 [Candidatus Magasanikbacteria bacterium CG_4_9_14_0_2_um_filter_42_11]
MEEDVRGGKTTEELHMSYSWIKARGAFTPGYTLKEIRDIQRHIMKEKPKEKKDVFVPEEIKNLVQEVQELVYLRTLRTDALYEMYHLAQPLFRLVEQELGIDSLGHYSSDDICLGNIERIPYEYAMLKFYDTLVIRRESIVTGSSHSATELSGVVASKGRVRGIAKILYTPADMDKVNEGDIIVTNMTNPSYVAAMHRAAAFVTNEGGITCHAAIIAREMQKPCVIGTKHATSTFVDGDIIDVDAEKGIVKKII